MQRIRALDLRRTGLVLSLAATLLAGLVLGPLGSDPANADQKIEADLVSDLTKNPDTPFWIRFGAKADLGKASAAKGRDARGTAVLKALRDTADTQQADVIAKVKAAGAHYHAFWASNTVYVTGGSLKLAEDLAKGAEVSRLQGDRVYKLPEPIKAAKVAAVNSAAVDTPVEWGLKAIGADRVWKDFGARGEGVVIGSIDSGAQFDHPALKASYRGTRADGTYDHNYNWYDPTNTCGTPSLEPCDNSGHGTHTIGTMTGGKGTTSDIGVAPGAKWISAKGCATSQSCTGFALLASGQWMLAPTDLNGNNPRPELRPDIINNSWGLDNGIAVEPFYQDMVNAWTAAGIFPVFANGNSGPGCNTAGSPGDYTSTYAAGAFDRNGNIASFSSRGQGENGEIKPNIAAPGVSILSAVPGSTYASMSGTSMAAPHTAGAVALLWSASPRLAHDIPATRALLDRTAVDVDDTSCGGTAADNNVWGEGKLDALALVDAAPREGTGTVTGKITDESGKPVAGASIHVTGALDRQLVSGSDGSYELRLTAGEYKFAVAAFGYTDTESTATVTADNTVTANITLKAAPKATVHGKVTDGSGHGWPLYAKITAEGVTQAGPWFTDPKTGEYQVTLPQTAEHTLHVEAVSTGYQDKSVQVPFTGDGAQDVALAITPDRCEAPGYGVKGLHETFDSGNKPAGWSVVTHSELSGWAFDDPTPLGNRTLKGRGGFASVSSRMNSFKPRDSELISPTVDLTGVSDPKLSLESLYRANPGFNPPNQSTISIDVSTDNGATWAGVWSRGLALAQESLKLPLPQAADKSQVKVRFHYNAPTNDGWWEIDDVLIGDATCRAFDGGLVVGQVSDRNTDTGLAAATVSTPSKESARSATTPQDLATGDGLYVLFSPAGEHELAATHDDFTTEKKSVTVRENAVTGADFTLDAGRLKVEQDALSGTVPFGERAMKKLTLTNTGKAPLTVETGAGGDAAATRSAERSKPNPEVSVKVKTSTGFLTPDSSPLSSIDTGTATGTQAGTAGDDEGGDWRTHTSYPAGISDSAVAVDDGKIYSIGGYETTFPNGIFGYSDRKTVSASYVYDPIAQSWSPIARPRIARVAAMAAFIDGKLYVTGGWSASQSLATLTEVYDPKTDTWTTAASHPRGLTGSGSAVLNGKLYLVGGCAQPDNTLVGTCNQTDVHVYDPVKDRWTRAADYPVGAAFSACGGIDGKLYCAGGMNKVGVVSDAYVYDPVYDHWSPIAKMPNGSWSSAYSTSGGKLLVAGGVRGAVGTGTITNAGSAYDPKKNTWSALPNMKYPLYRAGSACGTLVGGISGVMNGNARVQSLQGQDCDTGSVSWASPDRTRITLAPGERTTLTVALDSKAMEQPGTYDGALNLHTDSPYATPAVPMTLRVTPPPTWAKVAVTVKVEQCDGTSEQIQGAFVKVDGQTILARRSDADGQASVWLPVNGGGHEVTVIAAKDGWSSASERITVKQGDTQSPTLTLKSAGGCAAR
ncbi:S8 family serine peptidase [Streptomyces sp. NPDC056653]|uniref:S8 family serine peptidase n=1 Tax=Streptomyces sp. NPDC056653 TaxID=3345894 RepID=UPI0036B2D85A